MIPTALVGTELPDEVMGLPSAWLQAGSKDVLASLWPVSDSVTVEFMKKFYELHLLDQLDPQERTQPYCLAPIYPL